MRVLVLDTDPWRGMGIARVLDRAQDITAVLEKDLGDQTLSKSLASVVLVSEAVTHSDARRSLQAIRRKFPNARILVHGEQDDPSVIARFVADGADGYFALSLGEDKLLKAIRVLARGCMWLPEQAVGTVVHELRDGRTRALESALTTQEYDLLKMLEAGLSNKEMATRLGVAEVTIKAHLGRLFRRCGVKTRVQLLAYAMRNRLLSRH
jgi:DNA-binding NarL/FixJ family response regulator